jgi:hypothetical protein
MGVPNTNDSIHLVPFGFFPAKAVDAVVWDWVKQLLTDPQALMAAYREAQEQQAADSVAIQDQVDAIDRQIEKQQARLSRLLEELSEAEGAFTRASLKEKCKETEQVLETLTADRVALAERIEVETISDADIATIESFAFDVRDELETADFALKRRIVEALNLRGRMANEEGEKVLYLDWAVDTVKLFPEEHAFPSVVMRNGPLAVHCRAMSRGRIRAHPPHPIVQGYADENGDSRTQSAHRLPHEGVVRQGASDPRRRVPAPTGDERHREEAPRHRPTG